ncbi:hypothetical protein BH24CHL4_BH24CHL4_23490 [soil metagenome]
MAQGKGTGMGQISGIERLARLIGVVALVVSMATYATGEVFAAAGQSGSQVERHTD